MERFIFINMKNELQKSEVYFVFTEGWRNMKYHNKQYISMYIISIVKYIHYDFFVQSKPSLLETGKLWLTDFNDSQSIYYNLHMER